MTYLKICGKKVDSIDDKFIEPRHIHTWKRTLKTHDRRYWKNYLKMQQPEFTFQKTGKILFHFPQKSSSYCKGTGTKTFSGIRKLLTTTYVHKK